MVSVSITRGCLLLLCALLTAGCRNRAYTEVYVDNMAAEIRELEDQLYEYDYEYELLERELADLRRENNRLRNSASTAEELSDPPRAPSRKRDFRGGTDSLGDDREDPAMGADDLPARPRLAPGFDDSETTSELPESIRRRDEQPGPSVDADKELRDIDPESLKPPTIEFGDPEPPNLPSPGIGASLSTGAAHSIELNLSRIDTPTRLASAEELISDGGSDSLENELTNRTRDVENQRGEVGLIEDRRIVELAFHPVLSQSADWDDEDGVDGLYLVLQPRNEAGQMVPQAAELAVVALDLAKEGDSAKIGRWDFSQLEISEKMKKIGSDQGIHLSLPWQKVQPEADRVLVFARYEFPDGRQVIGERTIVIRGGRDLTAEWVPRSGKHSVVTASHSDPVGPGSFRASTARQVAAPKEETHQRRSVIRSRDAISEQAAPQPEFTPRQ